MLYDDRYHMHLGYYESNYDFESVALKRQSEEVWDIFFDFKQYGFINIAPENEISLEGLGTRIFSINNKELDYDIGVKRFEQWLSFHKII